MTCTSFSNPLSYIEWIGEGGPLNDFCNGPPDNDGGVLAEAKEETFLFSTYADFFGFDVPDPTKLPLEGNCSITEVNETTAEGLYYTYSTLTLLDVVESNFTKFVCHGTNDVFSGDQTNDDAYIEITFVGKNQTLQ